MKDSNVIKQSGTTWKKVGQVLVNEFKENPDYRKDVYKIAGVAIVGGLIQGAAIGIAKKLGE